MEEPTMPFGGAVKKYSGRLDDADGSAPVTCTWDLRMPGSVHKAGESCEVRAVAASPQLNADCGTDLFYKPDGFVSTAPACSGPAPSGQANNATQLHL